MTQAPKVELPQNGSGFSRGEILKRVSFAIECAGALYMTSAVIAAIALWRSSTMSLLPLLGTLAAPAVAALMFVLVSIIVPNLLRPGRLVIPLNITLPLVYCSFLLLAIILGPGSEPEILRLRDVLEWAMLWSRPGMLLILIGSQVVFLSALVWRGRRASRPVE